MAWIAGQGREDPVIGAAEKSEQQSVCCKPTPMRGLPYCHQHMKAAYHHGPLRKIKIPG
jgi:hypothetical protein